MLVHEVHLYPCAAPRPTSYLPPGHTKGLAADLWYGIALTEPEFCMQTMWASDFQPFPQQILYILLNCTCNTKLALAIHPQDAMLPSSSILSLALSHADHHCRTQLVHEQLLRMGEFQNVYDIEACYLCIQYAKYTNLLLTCYMKMATYFDLHIIYKLYYIMW